jgi:hypothetical protein
LQKGTKPPLNLAVISRFKGGFHVEGFPYAFFVTKPFYQSSSFYQSSANLVSFLSFFNLRNLLYLIKEAVIATVTRRTPQHFNGPNGGRLGMA